MMGYFEKYSFGSHNRQSLSKNAHIIQEISKICGEIYMMLQTRFFRETQTNSKKR